LTASRDGIVNAKPAALATEMTCETHYPKPIRKEAASATAKERNSTRSPLEHQTSGSYNFVGFQGRLQITEQTALILITNALQ